MRISNTVELHYNVTSWDQRKSVFVDDFYCISPGK